LREWSEGIIGSKSFQQVSEEFAKIVIPKVWRREGCKVARVAARLSISPKKVRRILRDQGLLADSREG
jgi:DNA-binding NtrC family response regulator